MFCTYINHSKQISFKDISIIKHYSQRRNKCKRKHQNRNPTFLVSLTLLKNWNYQFNFQCFIHYYGNIPWNAVYCCCEKEKQQNNKKITTENNKKKPKSQNWASLEFIHRCNGVTWMLKKGSAINYIYYIIYS